MEKYKLIYHILLSKKGKVAPQYTYEGEGGKDV
jgi:hypothetical protein